MGYCRSITSVDSLDSLDSNGGPDVDVSGQGCHADKEPIFIEGRQLLEDGCLDKIGPFWDLYFA